MHSHAADSVSTYRVACYSQSFGNCAASAYHSVPRPKIGDRLPDRAVLFREENLLLPGELPSDDCLRQSAGAYGRTTGPGPAEALAVEPLVEAPEARLVVEVLAVASDKNIETAQRASVALVGHTELAEGMAGDISGKDGKPKKRKVHMCIVAKTPL